jgi:hypothetical protein
MLFHVTWTFHNPSEEKQKRTLSLFQKWTPGPGQFKAFYGFADGTGGVALIEVETSAELAKTLAPWTPDLTFTTQAILPIQESSAIDGEALAWRDAN